MLLVGYQPRSPGMRHKINVKFPTFKNLKHPNLYCGFSNNAGRSNSGKRTVYSKGAWHTKRVFRKIVESLNKMHSLSLVTSISPRTDVRTAAALVRTCAGAWYYAPATSNTKLFSFIRTAPLDHNLTVSMAAAPHWYWNITNLQPHTKIVCVPIKHNSSGVLAKSAGCYCLIIEASLWHDWALIRLPSGVNRLVSNKNWVMTGVVAPTTKSVCIFKKSTKHLQYGLRPRVRGVAKNPNDHPHGGRTKSVKYARTPWGKTAKKSRLPSTKVEWKALNKRVKRFKSYNLPSNDVLLITPSQIPEKAMLFYD